MFLQSAKPGLRRCQTSKSSVLRWILCCTVFRYMCVCVCGPTRRGKRTNQQRSSMCSLPLSSAGQLWCMGVWTCGGGTCRHVNGSIRETSNPHACIPTTAVDIVVGAVVKSGRFLATYLGACGAVQRAEKLTATDPTTAMFGFKRRRDQKRAPPHATV